MNYEYRRQQNDNGFEIVLTHAQSKNVVLSCKATNVDLFENCVHLDIYRTDDFEHAESLQDKLKSIVFDEILTKHSIMISELQQTASGSRFFGYCLTRAIDSGMYVYHIKNEEITRVYDKKQLEECTIAIIECMK
jgi:hypothetical protein